MNTATHLSNVFSQLLNRIKLESLQLLFVKQLIPVETLPLTRTILCRFMSSKILESPRINIGKICNQGMALLQIVLKIIKNFYCKKNSINNKTESHFKCTTWVLLPPHNNNNNNNTAHCRFFRLNFVNDLFCAGVYIELLWQYNFYSFFLCM